ncbi:MAG TPA: 2Fe-2S iron-sulfur cluster-binding protein, partial [Candidatus Limnocylindrales bacterium]|nr:2Fe-2S iron-sulfur cluster-binding protein [Candidatus Limnocylindrales bacterium]
RQVPHPSRTEVEEGLAGNLCRCGCYYQIIDAVEAVAAGEPNAVAVASRTDPTPIPQPPVDQ